MAKILSFKEALQSIEGVKHKHLLLGNGFSRACRDDVFAYTALYDQAKEGMPKRILSAFDILKTTDFEWVMRALRQAAALVEAYAPKRAKLIAKLAEDADALREILAETIAGNHPDRPVDISVKQYKSCKKFLNHFESIYTLNYDLLLYWTLMQEELAPVITHDDGFRQPEDGPAGYVTWEVDKTDTQNVHYLHGALHIFDAGAEIQKFTWVNTGVALIDQIREALKMNKFPLFVSEGSSTEKLTRIQHSGLLNRSFRSFAKIQGALIIYGLSMSENDEHILKLLERGKTSDILVGLYGDPTKQSNEAIIKRAKLISKRRNPRRPVNISFFDAASAHVWDANV